MRGTLLLGALLLTLTWAQADYEFRYIEGETFSRGETEGVRAEGFTSWMGHPSGGKVEIFGRPAGGFLEYDLTGLQAGDYTILVRCLAIPTTRTRVLWDGRELGLIKHEQASTSLRWSLPLGPVAGPGTHVLRLQGSDDTTQWPYIDTILLTNAAGYVPPAQDQDFASYTTAWPPLVVQTDPATALAPEAIGSLPLPAGLTIQRVAIEPPVLGANTVYLTAVSDRAQAVRLRARFGQDPRVSPPAAAGGELAANVPQTFTLRPVAGATGPTTLDLGLCDGDVASGPKYRLTVPALASIALDEYAYPVTQRAGRWTATFTCAPELLPKLSAELTVTDLQRGKTVVHKTLPVSAAQLEAPFDLVGLPLGRFRAATTVTLGGRPAQSDSREFITYRPVAWPKWEPIRTAQAVGDTITVNGKPFLARMLYHAPANEEIAGHGFNLVQCYGADPDPTPGIQRCLDNCQQAGIYGTVALFNVQYLNQDTHFDLKRLEEVVLKFKDHPAVLCWDLIDEPDGTGMTPAAVQEAADLIRRLDPNHFVWVNLCRNTGASDYLASQDLWSYDSYPFPQMTPFDYKRRWLDITDRDLLGKKPLGTCLQTFNYNRHDQRMPTPDELRTSMWLHVIHGYKWFGYYSYYDGEPAGCLSRDPVLRSYTRALNTEMVQLEDVILAPGQWRDVAVEPRTDQVEAREKEVGGKLYVVIVSDSRAPVTVTLKPSWAAAKRRLLVEGEGKAVTGRFTVTLRPEATQVWEVAR